MTVRHLLLALALPCIVPPAASAAGEERSTNEAKSKLSEEQKKSLGENRQGAFEFGLQLGADLFEVGDSRQQLRNGFYGDLRIGYRPLRPIGVEGGLGFVPTSGSITGEGVFGFNPHLDVNFDILQFRVRPYAGLGFGGMFFFGPATVLHLEGHAQAGLKVALWKDLALRVEAKAMMYPSINPVATNAPFGYFLNGIFTVGLMYAIGGEPYRIDRDGDSVFDEDDRCPDLPGVGEYDGCPAPADSDGDGVLDDRDQCPDVPGSTENNGCPAPDQDGDSVADTNDECPVEPGSVELRGCPERPLVREESNRLRLEQARFETGKSEILPHYAKVLDSLSHYLESHQDVQRLGVHGHTDIEGTRLRNQVLSDERAQAVTDYLVSKGIAVSRLSPKGFGQDKPVASNRTPEGRAKNRRVEFVILARGRAAEEQTASAKTADKLPLEAVPPASGRGPLNDSEPSPAPTFGKPGAKPDVKQDVNTGAKQPAKPGATSEPKPPEPKPSEEKASNQKPLGADPTPPTPTAPAPAQERVQRAPLGDETPPPQSEAKPEPKPEPKPEAKPTPKQEAKPEQQRETKAKAGESQPKANKDAAKPTEPPPPTAPAPTQERVQRAPLGDETPPPKSEAKPEPKPEAKPEPKPTPKQEAKPEQQRATKAKAGESQPRANKDAAKPTEPPPPTAPAPTQERVQRAPLGDETPPPKSEAKPEPKPEAKPEPKPEAKPTPKQEAKPEQQRATKAKAGESQPKVNKDAAKPTEPQPPTAPRGPL